MELWKPAWLDVFCRDKKTKLKWSDVKGRQPFTLECATQHTSWQKLLSISGALSYTLEEIGNVHNVTQIQLYTDYMCVIPFTAVCVCCSITVWCLCDAEYSFPIMISIRSKFQLSPSSVWGFIYCYCCIVLKKECNRSPIVISCLLSLPFWLSLPSCSSTPVSMRYVHRRYQAPRPTQDQRGSTGPGRKGTEGWFIWRLVKSPYTQAENIYRAVFQHKGLVCIAGTFTPEHVHVVRVSVWELWSLIGIVGKPDLSIWPWPSSVCPWPV